jgi:hypothetical protein
MNKMQERLLPFPHFLTVTIEDWFRFWEKFKRKSDDECWLWTAGTADGEYGQFRLQGKHYYAHRVSYFLHNRIDPGELLVLHECNNTLCVNPAHLSLGTNSDNMKHRSESGYSQKGVDHPSAKFTESTVKEIIASPLTNAEEAEKRGVSWKIIYNIRQGKRWSHI